MYVSDDSCSILAETFFQVVTGHYFSLDAVFHRNSHSTILPSNLEWTSFLHFFAFPPIAAVSAVSQHSFPVKVQKIMVP